MSLSRCYSSKRNTYCPRRPDWNPDRSLIHSTCPSTWRARHAAVITLPTPSAGLMELAGMSSSAIVSPEKSTRSTAPTVSTVETVPTPTTCWTGGATATTRSSIVPRDWPRTLHSVSPSLRRSGRSWRTTPIPGGSTLCQVRSIRPRRISRSSSARSARSTASPSSSTRKPRRSFLPSPRSPSRRGLSRKSSLHPSPSDRASAAGKRTGTTTSDSNTPMILLDHRGILLTRSILRVNVECRLFLQPNQKRER